MFLKFSKMFLAVGDLAGKNPEKKKCGGDFSASDQYDAVEVEIDEVFYFLTPDHHGAPDERKAEEAGDQKKAKEGEETDVENACGKG